jgi:hypothetical protein
MFDAASALSRCRVFGAGDSNRSRLIRTRSSLAGYAMQASREIPTVDFIQATAPAVAHIGEL